MFFPFFFDPLFWILCGPFFLLAAWCSHRVKSTSCVSSGSVCSPG